MSETTPGPNQLDPDNGSTNFGGNFSRYGKGQSFGDAQPGEGVHPLPDGESVGMSSKGGANPPDRLPPDEVAGTRPSHPISHY